MIGNTKAIPVVLNNRTHHDYHFIINFIKRLIEEFEGQFDCLEENTAKYIIFSLPISKEIGDCKTIRFKIEFVDSIGFKAGSLLTHSAWQCFENLKFNKGTKHNFKRSYLSILRFSGSSFNFLQNSVIFFVLYPHEYTPRDSTPYNSRLRCQWLAGLKRFMISQNKFWIYPFFSVSFKIELKLLITFNFLPFGKNNVFT